MAELLYKKALALMHEDGALEKLKDSSSPFNFLKDLVLAVCDVDNGVRLIICCTDTDMLRGIRSIAVMR